MPCESGPPPSLSVWRHRWGWAVGVGLSLAVLLLGACAHPDQVLRIRGLAQPYDASHHRHSNGDFLGLDRIADFSRHNNLNVLFVHGIGWTQHDSPQGFGFDWVDALAHAYGVPSPRPDARTLCQTSGQDGTSQRRNTQQGGGVRLIQAHTQAYSTDDPLHQIRHETLGCLDRIRVLLGGGKSITVYRFFWDDTLWDGYQARHLGHDDPVPLVHGQKKSTPGQEDIDALRTPANSHLKNQLVTYGLSDAAMYLGPVGESMREGVRGALCAAAVGLDVSHLTASNASALCRHSAPQPQPLAVMAHSLGSRIVFDALHTDLHPELALLLQTAVSAQDIEVYMLANQLPLIGLGRLGQPRSLVRLSPHRLRLVAVSELDDPLTYELVPYFENLYYQRCTTRDGQTPPSAPTCPDDGGHSYHQRIATLAHNPRARQELVQRLGFDVIDIRARFAPAVLPGLGWLATDPHRAHSDYMSSRQVQQALICGAEAGRIRQRTDACPTRFLSE